MESPIPKELWLYMFHSTAAVLTAGVLFSLWRQSRSFSGNLATQLKKIRASKSPAEREGLVKDILKSLEGDAAAKKSTPHLSVQHNLKGFVDLLKFEAKNLTDDAKNPNEANELKLSNDAKAKFQIGLLRVIKKFCATDADGRHSFYQAGGYRRVMRVLGEAHRHGYVDLMKEAASTLEALTAVDEDAIVLPADVPFGCEGSASLAQFASMPKMLRTLDPSWTSGANLEYLRTATGMFANLSKLLVGTRAIQRGTDNLNEGPKPVPRLGAWFFLRLLHHSDDVVVENAAKTLQCLVCYGSSQHDEVSAPDNINRIIYLLAKGPGIAQPLLVLLRQMAAASPKTEQFYEQFVKADGVTELFKIWVKKSNDTIGRARAEDLVHTLGGIEVTAKPVKLLMERYRIAILERKEEEEQARRKETEQRRRQQYLNQMMLQEMFGGQDLSGMMGEED